MAFAIVLVLIGTLVPSVSSRITDLSIDRTDLPEDVPDNSLEWRLQYWELLVPLANESPVTGLGPQVILNSRPEELEPHNVYVQIYVEQGLLGLGALAAAVVGIGITLRRLWRPVRSLSVSRSSRRRRARICSTRRWRGGTSLPARHGADGGHCTATTGANPTMVPPETADAPSNPPVPWRAEHGSCTT